MNIDLQHIGDALENAIARDIATRNNVVALRHEPDMTSTTTTTSLTPRRRTRRVVIISALVTLAVGGAAAATAINLSSDEVSHGLPGGSAIFAGTDPSCTTTDDSNVFTCTLAHAPTEDVQDDYTGTLESFIDATAHVAGGCIGDTANGLHWTCYAGQLAVDKGIIGPDLLGVLQAGPARG